MKTFTSILKIIVQFAPLVRMLADMLDNLKSSNYENK
nr:hypothetical protein HWPLAUVJ_HWPLAUVJ_CDS_0003 [Microvirus sp.]